VAGLAVVGAALSFAYLARFWLGVFAGPRRAAPRPVPWLLVAPVGVLAAVSVAGGIFVEPVAHLAEAAGAVSHGGSVEISPAYHLDLRIENVMAAAAWGLGLIVLLAGSTRKRVALAVAHVGDRVGPRRIYSALLAGLNRISDATHGMEVRDLRVSLVGVLVPTGVFVALGFAATPTEGAYVVGSISSADLPIVVLLALAVVAAVTAARDRGRLRPVFALSVLGFSLAGVYAVMGAPDVALVAVVIETITTLVFVTVFSSLPGTTVGRPIRAKPAPHRVRNTAAGVVAGASAFAVIWAALSRPPLGRSDAAEHIRLAPQAHGGDVVTVILADFRGLDTMVEITVLAVAILGVTSLLRGQGRA
jgi:multicomponent Na+:H+ antiporter subunit A